MVTYTENGGGRWCTTCTENKTISCQNVCLVGSKKYYLLKLLRYIYFNQIIPDYHVANTNSLSECAQNQSRPWQSQTLNIVAFAANKFDTGNGGRKQCVFSSCVNKCQHLCPSITTWKNTDTEKIVTITRERIKMCRMPPLEDRLWVPQLMTFLRFCL